MVHSAECPNKRPSWQVFVTAASLNHLCPLLELLESIHRFAPANPVIVVTLDSKPPHIEEHWLTQVGDVLLLSSNLTEKTFAVATSFKCAHRRHSRILYSCTVTSQDTPAITSFNVVG